MTIDLRDTPWAGRYGVLYADPPWRFRTRSPKGKGAKSPEAHYRTEDVTALGRLPVPQVAAAGAWLFLWTTFPMLAAGDCHELVRAWSDPLNPWLGVTGGAWAKRPRNWRGDPDKWQFGPGYLFRSAAEVLVVFRRGDPPAWTSSSERNLWVAPIREHSRKPDQVREMIDRAVAPCPRLEMFARTAPAGWDAWGDQVERF